MDIPKIKVNKFDLDTYHLEITSPSTGYMVLMCISEEHLSCYFTPQTIILIKELQIGQELKPTILKIDAFYPTEEFHDLPKLICPNCGNGRKGIDPLCDSCYKEYLGTHIGARSED